MSNHKKDGGIAELVGPVLKRLELAKERVPENSKMEKFIDQIIPEIVKGKDILINGEKLKRELAGYLDKIERKIDPWIDHEPRKKVVSDLPHKETITEAGESSKTSYKKDTDSEVQDLMVMLEQSYRLVSKCLNSLELAKERVPENSEIEKFIDKIIPEVVQTKEILNEGEKKNRELAGCFDQIERQIDPWTDHEPRKKVGSDLPHKKAKTEVGESSKTSYEKDTELIEVQEHMVSLEKSYRLVSKCLKSLFIFPENTTFKKKLVIYWWMVLFRGDIEDCEMLLSYLVEEKFLIPVHNREHNQVNDCLTIAPTFHAWLISNSERFDHVSFEKKEEGTWCLYKEKNEHYMKMLLNLDQKYLNSEDIIDITSNNKHDHLEVVQLGNWRYTMTNVHNGVKETGSGERKSNDHIEVNQIDFLKKIPENVRFLSLRGISGITELHESIGKLDLLTVLDLRACHNLEKLPDKPRSILNPKLIRWALPQERWFENLKVLDISECYLLDYMPKWICELSSLEVLKGFVVGTMERNNQSSCQLGDLSKLNKLTKLSIRITVNISGPEVFSGFDSLDNLLLLTITWGQNKYGMIPTYSLPKNLEKLDIRCYPEPEASKLQNPDDLQKLKRLYIRGGNITKIPHNNNWKVEILRLRFLKNLVPTEWNEVRRSFKNLEYVEFVGCPRPRNFPNNEDSWRKSSLQERESVLVPGTSQEIPTVWLD